MCTIKDNDFTSIYVASALMMPEPATESCGYNTPSIRGQFVIFWVPREYPTTIDPRPCSLRNKMTKPDHVSEGPAPNLAPYDDDSTTFLYDLTTFICTR
jgi:hypothetical protein